MGKTTFAECIVDNVATQGKHVLFASLEMDTDELLDKRVARMMGQQMPEQVSAEDYERYVGLAGQFAADHIRYVDDGGLTSDRLFSLAYCERMRGPLDLVVVDYIQLLSDNVGHNDTERITYISRRLKTLARTLGVPILALSQLNREVEKRQNKRPKLSDLRSSGSLEQDADVVAFLYREAYYDKECGHDVVELDVAKHRHGSVGMVEVLFKPEQCRFLDLIYKRDREESAEESANVTW